MHPRSKQLLKSPVAVKNPDQGRLENKVQELPQMGAGKKPGWELATVLWIYPAKVKVTVTFRLWFWAQDEVRSVHSILSGAGTSTVLVSVQLLFFSHIHWCEARFCTLLKSTRWNILPSPRRKHKPGRLTQLRVEYGLLCSVKTRINREMMTKSWYT